MVSWQMNNASLKCHYCGVGTIINTQLAQKTVYV